MHKAASCIRVASVWVAWFLEKLATRLLSFLGPDPLLIFPARVRKSGCVPYRDKRSNAPGGVLLLPAAFGAC